MFDKPILNHAEVRELTSGGVMHEGLVSLLLGLPGMPTVAEDAMVARDILLAEATGGRIHIMHVSSQGSVELVRRAKRRSVRVTTEICPHHFTLTDDCLKTFDSNCKMSPPLRAARDVAGCIAGLVDGTIDVICTDHAPHALEKKMQELDRAPFGIVGLETALGLVVTRLIEPGHLDVAASAGQTDDQSRPRVGLEERNAGRRGRCRRDHHRPATKMGSRRDEICLEEQQFPLRWLDADRSGRNGPCRGAR